MNECMKYVGALLVAFTAQAEQVYFGNLHSHTAYSDGTGTPVEAFAYARDTAHLDFLAVTDHTQYGPMAKHPELYANVAKAAVEATQAGIFVGLVGQEYSVISMGNHVNVFDAPVLAAEATVPSGHFDRLVEWLDQNRDSLNEVPLVQFNHPAMFRKYLTAYGADDFGSCVRWVEEMGRCTSLLEVLNGPAGGATTNCRADVVSDVEYDMYLRLGFRLAPTANQDNHHRLWGTMTDTRTGVIASELTKPALLQALSVRHVYATEDKNLKIVAKVGGHLCGDILYDVQPGTVDVQVLIEDTDEPRADYQIEFRSGIVGKQRVQAIGTVSATGNGTHAFSVTYTGTKRQFLYLKVTQSGRVQDRSWTAPVWFE